MSLCKLHGRFLFEALPDLLPERFLTEAEIELWNDYYDQLQSK